MHLFFYFGWFELKKSFTIGLPLAMKDFMHMGKQKSKSQKYILALTYKLHSGLRDEVNVIYVNINTMYT